LFAGLDDEDAFAVTPAGSRDYRRPHVLEGTNRKSKEGPRGAALARSNT